MSKPNHHAGAGSLRAAKPLRVAALVLAAGASSRMRPANKLLVEIEGRPMVARVVDAALASRADPVVVVTGCDGQLVEAALTGRAVRLIGNPAYAEGLSSSLRCGLAALPAEVDGVLICLGDMPLVTAADLDRLIAEFDPAAGRAICVPTSQGRRGNPVLWARRFFPEMAAVTGDRGARAVLARHPDQMHPVAMPTGAVLLDFDTAEDLGRIPPGDAGA